MKYVPRARPASEKFSTAEALVVVPTYQEAHTIGRLLDEVARVAPALDVLVVDDDSPDGTARLVRQDRRYSGRVFLLERFGARGLAGAYRDGFAWALERGYDVVVQMDADLSHPPSALPRLIAALGDADVAVGSRYVAGGSTDGWTAHRRLLSRGGNLYVQTALGLHVADATSGFKAFRASALREIDVLSSGTDGYAFQIENAWRAERRGLRVWEVPIRFVDRTAGTSKMSGAIVREALIRVAGWRLKELVSWGSHPTAPELATVPDPGGRRAR
ncbi:polyprenol monophosphomannose synthase [Spongisporangium articulatum]|uniref:Polyprenol monophosphomannose synthase n=1 Tax=Spongisporangium articulatum TaxID=3362603 RepID=A0ABW8ARZ6_9ACTN